MNINATTATVPCFLRRSSVPTNVDLYVEPIATAAAKPARNFPVAELPVNLHLSGRTLRELIEQGSTLKNPGALRCPSVRRGTRARERQKVRRRKRKGALRERRRKERDKPRGGRDTEMESRRGRWREQKREKIREEHWENAKTRPVRRRDQTWEEKIPICRCDAKRKPRSGPETRSAAWSESSRFRKSGWLRRSLRRTEADRSTSQKVGLSFRFRGRSILSIFCSARREL